MPKHQPGSIAEASRELGISRAERKKIEVASEHGAETNRMYQEERRSKENQERRAEQRQYVEQVIEEVTGEQIGNAGMSNSDMTRTRRAKGMHTPVHRAEAAPTEEQPSSESDTEQEAA